MSESEDKLVNNIPDKKVRDFIGENILNNLHINKLSVKNVFDSKFRINVWVSVLNDDCVVPLSRVIKSWFVSYNGDLIKDETKCLTS